MFTIAFVVALAFDVGLFVWAYRRNHRISKEQRERQEYIDALDAYLKQFRSEE